MLKSLSGKVSATLIITTCTLRLFWSIFSRSTPAYDKWYGILIDYILLDNIYKLYSNISLKITQFLSYFLEETIIIYQIGVFIYSNIFCPVQQRLHISLQTTSDGTNNLIDISYSGSILILHTYYSTYSYIFHI